MGTIILFKTIIHFKMGTRFKYDILFVASALFRHYSGFTLRIVQC
jgi:hypothetical protein